MGFYRNCLGLSAHLTNSKAKKLKYWQTTVDGRQVPRVSFQASFGFEVLHYDTSISTTSK